MLAQRSLCALTLLVAAGACSDAGGAEPGPDAATEPVISAQRFTSTTWSLSIVGGVAQLSITDGAGSAACALSLDHRQSLGATGQQIILRLPGTVTGPCPVGGYSLTKCPATLGTATTVPEGCAFYRKWSADGTSLGIAAAINGEITVSGTATSCTLRTNVGFVGASFAETFTMMNGAAAQPWCMGS